MNILNNTAYNSPTNIAHLQAKINSFEVRFNDLEKNINKKEAELQTEVKTKGESFSYLKKSNLLLDDKNRLIALQSLLSVLNNEKTIFLDLSSLSSQHIKQSIIS